jgi:hypothetical protein
MPLRSESLFKVTVFILTIPGFLLLLLTIRSFLVLFLFGKFGVVGWGFTLTKWELAIAVAAGLGLIILISLAMFLRQKPKTGPNG